jgi:hypothetical protein
MDPKWTLCRRQREGAECTTNHFAIMKIDIGLQIWWRAVTHASRTVTVVWFINRMAFVPSTN